MWYIVMILCIWSGNCSAMHSSNVVTVYKDKVRMNTLDAWEGAMIYHAQRSKLPADYKTLHVRCTDYLMQFTREHHKAILAQDTFVMVHKFENSLVWLPFLNPEREARVLTPMNRLAQVMLCSVLGNQDHSVICAVDAENSVHKWTLRWTHSARSYQCQESYINYTQSIPCPIRAVRLLHEHAAVLFCDQGVNLAVDSDEQHAILSIPDSGAVTRIKANIKHGLYKCSNADKSSRIYRIDGNRLMLVENEQAEKKFKSGGCIIQ